MDVSKELFDEFINWLKLDGLTPKKSERLWKKTILARLINGHKNTKDNWEDFMADFNQKHTNQNSKLIVDDNCLIGMGISVNGISKTIEKVVKHEETSRFFFVDGTKIDVENEVIVKLIDECKRSQK